MHHLKRQKYIQIKAYVKKIRMQVRHIQEVIAALVWVSWTADTQTCCSVYLTDALQLFLKNRNESRFSMEGSSP